MSTKISIDNHFIDCLLRCEETIREKIISRFRGNRFSLYVCSEFMDELFGIYETNHSSELLKQKLTIFLQLMGHRIFQSWHSIVRSELNRENGGVFENSTMVNNLKENIRDLLKARTPAPGVVALLKRIRARKEKQKEYYSGLRSEVLKLVRGMERPDFEEHFNSPEVRAQRVKFLNGLIEIEMSESQKNEVLDQPDRYPYYSISSRILHGLFYWYHAKGKEVDMNDFYDASQLIYTAHLDYFISNEKRLKEWDKLFIRSNKILNFTEFIQLVN